MKGLIGLLTGTTPPIPRDTVDRAWLGVSGNLRIRMILPFEVRAGSRNGSLPQSVAVAPDGDSISLVTLRPFADQSGSRLGRYRLAEEVEQIHPELIGGLSAYPATGSHGPFLHVDARGHRARW